MGRAYRPGLVVQWFTHVGKACAKVRKLMGYLGMINSAETIPISGETAGD